MVTLASIVIAVPFAAGAGLLLGIAGFRSTAAERAAAAGARSDADRAGLRLSGADPHPLRLRSGLGDAGDHRLRHAAHGPGHPPGAPPGAGGDHRVRPDGRLHQPPAALAGAAADRAPGADGRPQPGDHAVAQHGDHRLHDRRRRPRLRRAHRPSPPRHRRRARGRARHHRAGHRPRPAEPGGGRRLRQSRLAARSRAPLAHRACRLEHGARPARALARHLPAGAAGLDGTRLGRAGPLDQRQLLRPARGLPDRHADQPPGAGEALPPGPALALGRGPAGVPRLAARRLAAGRSGRRAGALHRGAPGSGRRP